MTPTADLIVASVGVFGALGAAGKFAWNKIEMRFDLVDEALDECRTRELDSQHRRGVLLTVIELLWQEVNRHVPHSNALVRAQKLLDDLKTQARKD